MTYVTVQAEISLSDIDSETLIEELERRQLRDEEIEPHPLLIKIWEKRRLGKDYQTELDTLLYDVLGKVL